MNRLTKNDLAILRAADIVEVIAYLATDPGTTHLVRARKRIAAAEGWTSPTYANAELPSLNGNVIGEARYTPDEGTATVRAILHDTAAWKTVARSLRVGDLVTFEFVLDAFGNTDVGPIAERVYGDALFVQVTRSGEKRTHAYRYMVKAGADYLNGSHRLVEIPKHHASILRGLSPDDSEPASAADPVEASTT